MVQFSPEAADGLGKAAERAASTLRVQGWSRSQLASHACEGFSGRHARTFAELCIVEAAIPGVGTVGGGLVGGLIGGFAGTTAGQWLGDQIKDVAGKAAQGVADAATRIGAGIAVGAQSAGTFFGGLFGT